MIMAGEESWCCATNFMIEFMVPTAFISLVFVPFWMMGIGKLSVLLF